MLLRKVLIIINPYNYVHNNLTQFLPKIGLLSFNSGYFSQIKLFLYLYNCAYHRFCHSVASSLTARSMWVSLSFKFPSRALANVDGPYRFNFYLRQKMLYSIIILTYWQTFSWVGIFSFLAVSTVFTMRCQRSFDSRGLLY